MFDLGTVSNYLGIKIVQTEECLFIHQKGYIQRLLKKFCMQECNNVKLLMDPKVQLQKNMNSRYVDLIFYRFLVDSLIFAANTRPNISYAVSCVSRYMEQPQEDHL